MSRVNGHSVERSDPVRTILCFCRPTLGRGDTVLNFIMAEKLVTIKPVNPATTAELKETKLETKTQIFYNVVTPRVQERQTIRSD